jgi:hypothetical protein
MGSKIENIGLGEATSRRHFLNAVALAPFAALALPSFLAPDKANLRTEESPLTFPLTPEQIGVPKINDDAICRVPRFRLPDSTLSEALNMKLAVPDGQITTRGGRIQTVGSAQQSLAGLQKLSNARHLVVFPYGENCQFTKAVVKIIAALGVYAEEAKIVIVLGCNNTVAANGKYNDLRAILPEESFKKISFLVDPTADIAGLLRVSKDEELVGLPSTGAPIVLEFRNQNQVRLLRPETNLLNNPQLASLCQGQWPFTPASLNALAKILAPNGPGFIGEDLALALDRLPLFGCVLEPCTH